LWPAFQLAAHPLLLDDQCLMTFEVGGHAVERGGERAELVSRPHGHASLEIAPRELPHARAQRGDVLRHSMGDRHDPDAREDNDTKTDGEIAPGRAPNLAKRFADWTGDAKYEAGGILSRDDDPVAEAGRRTLGGSMRAPRDLQAFEGRALLRVGVERSALIDREGNLPLIPPRQREHGTERSIEVHDSAGFANDLARFPDGDLDLTAAELHLHARERLCAGGFLGSRFRNGRNPGFCGRHAPRQHFVKQRTNIHTAGGCTGFRRAPSFVNRLPHVDHDRFGRLGYGRRRMHIRNSSRGSGYRRRQRGRRLGRR
jgi:hypothetical protein